MSKSDEILDYRYSMPIEGGASFNLRHRVQRMLWIVVWSLFASWTPAPLHRWRVFLLKLFGAQLSWSAHVYSSTRVWFPRNLRMGDHACLGPDVNCYNMALTTLGDYAIVSQGAHLCSGTHDIDDEFFQLIAKPITIEDGAWVAAGAFVGPGVTVAAKSVVGARAVVFKDTTFGMVYVGNPAKPIRARRC